MAEAENVAYTAFMDQCQAELRDTAVMAATYYQYLRYLGISDRLTEKLVRDWHTFIWEQTLAAAADETE